MTETEWLAGCDTQRLLEYAIGKVGQRKLQLFACACCRRVWSALGQASRRLIEVDELHVDGRASDEELQRAFLAAAESEWRVAGNPTLFTPWRSSFHAFEAVLHATRHNALEPRRNYDCGIVADQATIAAYYEVVRGRGGDIEREFPSAEIDWDEENVIRHAEASAQCQILRDIVGNPFCLAATTVSPDRYPRAAALLAQSIYDDRDFDRLPELADALDRAGCCHASVSAHCRESTPHVLGCWVLDLLLDKT